MPSNWVAVDAAPIVPGAPAGGTPPTPSGVNPYGSGALPSNLGYQPALVKTGYPASTGPVDLFPITGGAAANAKIQTIIKNSNTNVTNEVNELISLEVNGIPISDQSVLNLQNGQGIVVSTNAGGVVFSTSTSNQLILYGSTSGTSTITAPPVAGTAANPLEFSNGIDIPESAGYSINGNAGISSNGAGVILIGNGTPGNKVGALETGAITTTNAVAAGGNLITGTVGLGSGEVVFTGSVSGTAVITGPSTTGIQNPFLISNSTQIPAGSVYAISTDTGLSRAGAGVIAIGDGTAGDTTGTVQASVLQLGGIGAPTITTGAGVPSGTPENGSLYVRTGGNHAAQTLLYIYDALTTTWIGIA